MTVYSQQLDALEFLLSPQNDRIFTAAWRTVTTEWQYIHSSLTHCHHRMTGYSQQLDALSPQNDSIFTAACSTSVSFLVQVFSNINSSEMDWIHLCCNAPHTKVQYSYYYYYYCYCCCCYYYYYYYYIRQLWHCYTLFLKKTPPVFLAITRESIDRLL